jgi:hypothetical protein
VHAKEFELVGLDAAGTVTASMPIPPITPETGPAPDDEPISVETISDGNDLSLVLGVHGRVLAQGAVSLELRYPDGTTVSVPLAADGSYRIDIPRSRQDAFAQAPGTLLALDGSGHVVGSSVLASVAWWEARNRSRP